MKKINKIIIVNIMILMALTVFIGIKFDDAYYTTSVLEGQYLSMALYRSEWGHLFKLIVCLFSVSLTGLIAYSVYLKHHNEVYQRAGNKFTAIREGNYKSLTRILEYFSLGFLVLTSFSETYRAFTIGDTAMGHKVIESNILLTYWPGILIVLAIILVIEIRENRVQ